MRHVNYEKTLGSLHSVIVDTLYANPEKYFNLKAEKIAEIKVTNKKRKSLHIFPYSNQEDMMLKKKGFRMYERGGVLHAEPDLYFSVGGKLYFYKVKSDNSCTAHREGLTQCQRIHEWMEQHHNDLLRQTEIGLVLPKKIRRKLDTVLNNLEVIYYKSGVEDRLLGDLGRERVLHERPQLV